MSETSSLQETYQKLKVFYHSILLSSELSLEYLRIRGLNLETIKYFQLGYTYGNLGWRYLKNPCPLFLKSGKGYSDLFSNRIIIPIQHNGDVISFTSRAILDIEPKHLHLPGPIPCFFNHDSIKKSVYTVAVESPIDCMVLQQNGFSSIGTMGTNGIQSKALTDLLKKQVFICFDQDENESGLQGAIKLSDIFRGYKIKHKIVILPKDGQKNDVATFFLNHSAREFNELLINSVDISSLNIQRKFKSESINPQGQSKILCPFHKDAKPSLVIYYDTQSYYCFGCGRYGPLSEI